MSADLPATSPELAAITDQLRAAGCVYAEEEAELVLATTTNPFAVADMVARRVAGEPLEHVLGWARFAGLRIAVGPGVFVPRRRSEFLVRVAADLLTARKTSSPQEQLVAVDLCCGSGALGAALFARVGGLELHCADIDPVAVDYARRNLLGTGAQVHCGDLVAPLPRRLQGRVEVLVANVPYIPTLALRLLPGEARLHEPRAALAGGPDGLDVARRVAAAAPGWLAPGGHLLIETSRDQAPAAVAAFTAAGLVAEVSVDDELAATVVVGRHDKR